MTENQTKERPVTPSGYPDSPNSSSQALNSWRESSITSISQTKHTWSFCTLVQLLSSDWGFLLSCLLLMKPLHDHRFLPKSQLHPEPQSSPPTQHSDHSAGTRPYSPQCFYFPLTLPTNQSFPLTLVITGQAERKMVQEVHFICPWTVAKCFCSLQLYKSCIYPPFQFVFA